MKKFGELARMNEESEITLGRFGLFMFYTHALSLNTNLK